MKSSTVRFAAIVVAGIALLSCGGARKLQNIQKEQMGASLVLSQESDVPELEYRVSKRDTIIIKDDKTGKDILLMKAVRDADGDMVANDILDAAVVTARFRNVAERRGKVDLCFQIIVPAGMLDNAWQLRFDPDMFILGDSLRLDRVVITGKGYRNAQLRGYQQYERFLSRIISDTTKLININQLERFLSRNIPEVFAFKSDTSYVSDEQFYSYFGVSEREAVDHYTLKLATWINNWRKANKDKMFRRYVRVPIVTEGIRLDTVIVDANGDFVYNYVQTINTRPKLKKVDIVLSGSIYEEERRIYTIPRTEPLTFYISSVSAFADASERYLTRVIERRAEANASYKISFAVGKSDVRLDLADNYDQIGFVKENLTDLLRNEVFDLDSIVVIANASPEGSWSANNVLSRKRGESVVRYFESFMDDFRRQVARDGGFEVDESGNVIKATSKIPRIRFMSRSVPENWKLLDMLVDGDLRMTEAQKERYRSLADIRDKDAREAKMRGDDYYRYMRDSLYPRLRVVDFAFHLHRKGMVKDTVHTTELDSTYMRGVQLLRDMDYDEAVKLLGPYQDYNAAVAYLAAERNASAMLILNNLPRTAQVNYLLAILYSRMGNEKDAVQCYMNACSEEPLYVHRGNLDPEISALIKLYGLNKQDDFDEEEYY